MVRKPLPLPVTAADRRERAARVGEIARRVADGDYRVPAERVADAMLSYYEREA